MKGQGQGGSLRVKQVRSGIGFDKTQKGTLKALGLGRSWLPKGQRREDRGIDYFRAHAGTASHSAIPCSRHLQTVRRSRNPQRSSGYASGFAPSGRPDLAQTWAP